MSSGSGMGSMATWQDTRFTPVGMGAARSCCHLGEGRWGLGEEGVGVGARSRWHHERPAPAHGAGGGGGKAGRVCCGQATTPEAQPTARALTTRVGGVGRSLNRARSRRMARCCLQSVGTCRCVSDPRVMGQVAGPLQAASMGAVELGTVFGWVRRRGVVPHCGVARYGRAGSCTCTRGRGGCGYGHCEVASCGAIRDRRSPDHYRDCVTPHAAECGCFWLLNGVCRYWFFVWRS